MYDYLKGNIAEKKPTSIIVDVNGVGYLVAISLNTFESLPSKGKIKLYTFLKVSENDMRLYGFSTKSERDVFTLCVNHVSGLGASKALAILSHVNLDDFVNCIEEHDVSRLKRVKGVGEKLAQRIIVEMKGKLLNVYTDEEGTDSSHLSVSREATLALVALGYQYSEASKVVKRIIESENADIELEHVVKSALQSL